MKKVKSDMRVSLSDQTLSNCMAVILESATIEVFNPEPSLLRWWEAKLRRLGGKGRGKNEEEKGGLCGVRMWL